MVAATSGTAELPQLRAALGLRDKDDDAQRLQEIRAALPTLNNLPSLRRSLPSMNCRVHARWRGMT